MQSFVHLSRNKLGGVDQTFSLFRDSILTCDTHEQKGDTATSQNQPSAFGHVGISQEAGVLPGRD